MERFAAEWLALREPADVAARSESLARVAAARLEPRGAIHAVDLAAGTGSNVRYLAGRLAGPVHWTLLDHDRTLLDEARRRLGAGGLGAEYALTTRVVDLTTLDPALVDDQDLVTASAFLDLVSAAWIEGLARHCRHARAVVLLALTFDGRIDCTPPHPDDALVQDLVCRHQRHDKGFGPALGPDAHAMAEACFVAEGFAVRSAASDWTLDSPRLMRELIEGWARAAADMHPAEAARIGAWEQRRLAHVLEGRSRIRVGHRDLVAWLP